MVVAPPKTVPGLQMQEAQIQHRQQSVRVQPGETQPGHDLVVNLRETKADTKSMKCVAEARDGRTKDVQVFRDHL